jgi:hypothetical protein
MYGWGKTWFKRLLKFKFMFVSIDGIQTSNLQFRGLVRYRLSHADSLQQLVIRDPKKWKWF